MTDAFIENDDFNPIEQDDSAAVLEGLQMINEELENKKGKKEKAKKNEAPQEEEKAEQSKYPQADLLAIFDKLVFEGEYQEEFKGRGLKLTLRSRSGDDAINISRAVDKFEGKTFMTVQTYANMLTLAHSLVSFNGKAFGPKDTAAKYKFLLTLPDPILVLLIDKLKDFDEKIGLAIAEGRKNF